MFILGLQGSPRKKGNTFDLLSMFMEEAEKYGALTKTVCPHSLNIEPCKELIVCEKKGFCPIKDDMDKSIYGFIKNADIVVLASPVFFYNVPAQLKALIDRCQMFWGRKYKLKLEDPNSKNRQGFLLSCGASGGKKLFEGLELTAKIFFDAISVKYKGSLTYRHIEEPGQIASHSTVKEDIRQVVKTMCEPFLSKKKILFVSKKDACRSQMAAAFFRLYDKEGRFEVLTAGFAAADSICPETVRIMAEKNLDLKYIAPVPLEKFTKEMCFDMIICLDKNRHVEDISCHEFKNWEMHGYRDQLPEELRVLRDEIESRVNTLISSLP